MKRGKFIVIEGIDGSGKASQVKFLEDFLRTKLGTTKLLVTNFPRYYSSEWGKLVGDFLTGKFGKLSEVSPYLSTLTYMLDQYTWSRDIGKPWVESGGWILSDRYFTSNVHQIARLKTQAKARFRQWLWRMGYDELGITRPDLVVFLDRHPRDSMQLNKKKGSRDYLKKRKRDIAEKDSGHQLAAYTEYIRTVKETKEWVAVPCVTTNDIGSDTKVIQDRIRDLITKRLF